MRRLPSTELELAAACCRWPPSAESGERIAAAAAEVTDWEQFEALITRHRIRPLAHRALIRVDIGLPDAFRVRLKDLARRAGERALLLASESLRLQKAFAARGMPNIIIKGTPLALLAYGDIAMKESIDVDLVVAPDDAAKGRQLLAEFGYKPSLDSLGAREFGGYARHIHAASFFNSLTGISVDLHWRFVPHRRLLAADAAAPVTQDIRLAGGSLRTLADEALFAYLCTHGALHNWSRLKWLADLNALLATRPESEVMHLYQGAKRAGVGRCAAVALQLCQQLLGLSLNERFAASLKSDIVVQSLTRNVIAGLAHRGGLTDPRPFNVPWFRLTAAQFFLAPGLRHSADQLRVFWNAPGDRALFLPRGLEFTYHITRLPRLLARTGWRVIGGLRL